MACRASDETMMPYCMAPQLHVPELCIAAQHKLPLASRRAEGSGHAGSDRDQSHIQQLAQQCTPFTAGASRDRYSAPC